MSLEPIVSRHNQNVYEVEERRPAPTDFEAFLPWACTQMQMDDLEVVVSRNLLSEYVSVVPTGSKPRGRSKQKLQSTPELSSERKESVSIDLDPMGQTQKNNFYITTVYNTNEDLVELKFEKNKTIPCRIMKILGLIIKFHVYLNSITINKGLNAYVLYELCKILPISNITSVCLDNNHLKEGNYFLLLENVTSLKNISLSRCGINDVVVSMIAEKLAHPMPASSFLLALNLSTNCITDVGAKSIADALRTNGKLAYLNLADNMISDEGAKCILDSLKEFLLTEEELMNTRRSKMKYLRERNALIVQLQKDMQATDMDRKSAKKKVPKMPAPTAKKSKALDPQQERSFFNFDQYNNSKAEALVDSLKAPFKDPFSEENIIVRDREVFCLGNNTLCYLNLAYNNLTYSSVQRLLQVIEYQSQRKPRGLVNVCLEGNLLPERCAELTKIDSLLDMGLAGAAKLSGMFGSQKQRKHSKIVQPPR